MASAANVKTETEFTPGPWEVLHSDTHADDTIVICGGNNDDLAEVFSNERCTVRQSHDEALGNARLIAAAPELLAALEKAAMFVGWASVRQQVVRRASKLRSFAT